MFLDRFFEVCAYFLSFYLHSLEVKYVLLYETLLLKITLQILSVMRIFI